MGEEHERTEPEQDERAEEVEDLEVPEGQQEDVGGGAWPKKIELDERGQK
jgi:hypothetical protein